MKRPTVLIALLIAMLSVLAACSTTAEDPAATEAALPAATDATASTGDTSAESGAESAEPDAIKLVTLPFISFAPFFIAVEEGFFADQGLDVELVAMSGMRDVVPALATGEVDVASGLVSAGVLNAIAREGDIRYVADKGFIDPDGCPNYVFTARQELADSADFTDPATWDGLNVDTPPTTWLDYYMDIQLDALGVPRDAYTQSSMSVVGQGEALAQGTLDVVLNSEPWPTILTRAGHQPILPPVGETMPGSQSAVVFYGGSMYEKDPDVGNRFMAAYLQAVRQYNEGKTDRNQEILLNYIDMDPELLAEMCWPTLRADGRINAASLLDFQEWAVTEGVVEAPLELEQIYDDSFVEAANAALNE